MTLWDVWADFVFSPLGKDIAVGLLGFSLGFLFVSVQKKFSKLTLGKQLYLLLVLGLAGIGNLADMFYELAVGSLYGQIMTAIGAIGCGILFLYASLLFWKKINALESK